MSLQANFMPGSLDCEAGVKSCKYHSKRTSRQAFQTFWLKHKDLNGCTVHKGHQGISSHKGKEARGSVLASPYLLIPAQPIFLAKTFSSPPSPADFVGAATFT